VHKEKEYVKKERLIICRCCLNPPTPHPQLGKTPILLYMPERRKTKRKGGWGPIMTVLDVMGGGGVNPNDRKRAWWSFLFLFRAALSVCLTDTHEIRIICFPVYEYTRFNFSSNYCTNAKSPCLTSKKMAKICIIESRQC
jgi:hypothetical protein